jgi:hypothetical protein
MEKNILVPLGPHNKGIRGVHHALALAKRIQARVFILEWVPWEAQSNQRSPGEDMLADLITAARQAGLNVSHHKARGPFKKELFGFVQKEGIHVLVLEEGEEDWNRVLHQTGATLPTQVILVKQKRARNTPRRRKEG